MLKKDTPHTIDHKRLLAQAERFANIGTWEVDFETNKSWWSDQYFRICGLEPRSLSPTPEKALELIHPDDTDRIRTEFERSRSAGKPFHQEFRIVRPDKTIRTVVAQGSVERNREGAPVRMNGIFMDLTDRLHEQTPTDDQSCELFRQISKTTHDAVWALEADSGEMHLGAGFASMFGIETDVDNGGFDQWKHRVHPDDLPDVEQTLTQIKSQNGDVKTLEFRFKNAQNEYVWTRSRISVMRDEDGEPRKIIGAMSDISDDRHQERQQAFMKGFASMFNSNDSVNTMLVKTLEKIHEHESYVLGEAWLVSPDTGSIKLAEAFTEDENYSVFQKETARYRQLTPGEDLAGTVWEQGDQVVIDDVAEDTRFIRGMAAARLGVKRACGIPIKHNEQVIGVLVLGIEEAQLFSQDDLNMYEDAGRTLGGEIKRRKIEEELTNLFDFSPDIICMIDLDGHIKRVNPAGVELLGYTADELAGTRLADRVHPDDSYLFRSRMRGLGDKRPTAYQESRFITKAGHILWLGSTCTLSPGEGLIYLIGRDITDRKSLEATVEQANRLARIGAWEIDLIRMETWWSDIARDIFEAPEGFEPTIHKMISMFRRGTSRGRFRMCIDSAIGEGKSWDEELEIDTARGNRCWLRVIGEVEVADNKPVRIYGSMQDINERKVAELSYQIASDEKESILDSISDAFYALDAHWQFTYFNRKSEQLLDRRQHEVIGKSIWDVFPKMKHTELYNRYYEVIRTGEPDYFEFYYPVLEEWYEVSVYPSKGREGLTVYYKLITERKRNEYRLQELNTQMELRARELAISNAELEQFATVTSHDLQEPLRMISGFLSQLERKYSHLLDEKGKRYIYFASDGAKRMRKIILDLLNFSRVGNAELEKSNTDIHEVVQEILAHNRRLIEETGAKVQIDDMPMVPTVRALIRQVFQHLLENAIKYRKADIKPEISLSASELDNHWEFRIKDNGIGIAPEFHEKIFSIFQRLHDNTEYSGTGMGLAIVKKIVETHGGEIRVESSEGAGSTFIFTLGKSLAGAASGSMTPANLNSRGTNSHGLKSYGSMPEDRNPGSPFNDTAASVSTKKSARHIPGSPGYSGNTQTNEPSAKNESTG